MTGNKVLIDLFSVIKYYLSRNIYIINFNYNS